MRRPLFAAKRTPLPLLFGAAVAIAVLTASPAAAAGYKFTSFQHPSAAAGTTFTSIDDSGRITGWTNTATVPLGFIETAAGSLASFSLPGFLYTLPFAINRVGGVVGSAFDGVSLFMYQNNANGQTTIPATLANQSVSSINSGFSIAGNYTAGSGPAAYAILRGVTYTLMPASTCQSTHDPALNDGNTVAGSCVTKDGRNIGFVWSRGAYTYIQPPAGSTYLQPAAINRSGVVAGFYYDGSGFSHGFVYSNGALTTVDHTAPGAYNTQVFGINNAGKLVGSYFGPGLTAFTATPQQ